MKKVLSLVLTLALVLSSFSMAFADEAKKDEAKPEAAKAAAMLSDIAGNANEEAIGVVNDLGIVTGNPDGTFQPEKAVTRAEFAAMITRALAIPQSALAGYASTSFKDTDGYGWAVGYLAFCNSKGIMLGDGQGNAMPGKTITLNEAVTMTLRALGYTANSAELKGNWPSNYVTKAQELNLYEDLAKDLVGVDKANAAQLIYNTLTQKKVAVDSDGKTDYVIGDSKTKKPATLLSAGLNCADEKEIITVGKLDDGSINMAKHLGKYGTVYTSKKTDKVVAFISDSTQLVGKFKDENTFVTTDGEKEYTVGTAAYKFDLNDDKKDVKTQIIEVRNPIGGTTELAAFGAPFVKGMDQIEWVLNADVSGKTIKTIYSAVEWKLKAAKKVKAQDISRVKSDKSLLGYDFAENDNKEIDMNQFVLVGVASLDDIKADDVVYVYTDENDKIRKVEVSNQVVEGKVKSFKNASSTRVAIFTVGDKELKNAKDVLNSTLSSLKEIKSTDVSKDVKVLLDARGFVFDVSSSTKNDNIAVVKGTGSFDQAKVLLADGNEKVLDFESGDVDIENAAGALIGYGLNKNGKITSANLGFVTADITLASKYYINAVANAAKPAKSKAVAGSVPTKGIKIADDVVVFTKDGSKYAVSKIDKVKTDESIVGATLLFDEDGATYDYKTVIAMIVPKDKAQKGDETYAVLNEKYDAIDDDGDKVYKVIGLKNGEKLDTIANDRGKVEAAWGSPNYDKTGMTAEARLYQVEIDSKGVITGIKNYNTVTPDYAKAKVVSASDNRRSVELTKLNGDSIDGKTFADNVIFYELTKDSEFRLSGDDLQKDDIVWLFNTDTDDAAIEVVIYMRAK